MITEKQEELLIKRITDRINKANEYFLKSIGSYIKEIKGLSPTKAQQLIQILKYGGNYEDIIKQIEKTTDINIKDIEEIFKEYAKKDAMFYEQFYQYRNKPFNNNLLDDELKALSRVSQKTIYDYTRPNVLGFTIRDTKNNVMQFLNLKETYNMVLEEALLNVSQGKETFDVSMRKILEDIGKSGLRKVEYESGRSYRLDSIVRMHLKDSLRDLHNRNVELYGEGFDADGYEISVHRYPAEDHEDIQGRQLYKDEYEKLQESGVAKDVNDKERDIRTKYGFRPISTMNCYHYIFPIIVGVNKPEYTEEQLKAIKEENDKGFDFEGQHYSMYEGTQLQRNIERNIREQKDIQILARASGDEELAMSSQRKINLLSKKYKELSDISNLPTQKNRLSVKGYRKIKVKEESKAITKVDTIYKNNSSKAETFNFTNYQDKFKQKDITLNDDLQNMNRELLQRNVEHLDYLTNKYNITTNQTLEINMQSNPKHIGTTWYRTNRIGLNKKYYSDKEHYLEVHEYSQKTKWHSPVKKENLDLYTLTHEFGHAVENDYIRRYLKEHKGINTSIKQSGMTISEKKMRDELDKEIRDDIFSYIRKKEKTNITEIKNNYFSDYAKSQNHYEWFAETFTQLELGEQNLLTEAMQDWLERNKK